MKIKIFVATCFLVLLFSCGSTKNGFDRKINKPNTALHGYAKTSFVVGSLLFEDKLDNQTIFNKNWVVQQSKADPQISRYAKIDSGKLVVHDPRGTTIWFKNKLEGAVLISYKVMVPDYYNQGNDIMCRDVNQFWMASTPNNIDVNEKAGLFDSAKYNGEFKPYDDLLTYYASTGGGNTTINNRTTRMRRYPRSIEGKLTDHVGLNYRDDNKDFLIMPNKEHFIQLIAAEDIVQYIFDGKIVYQVKNGDTLDVFNDGSKNVTKAIWGDASWKKYLSGYFGFRMTRTHHIYSDFKVYKLINIKKHTQ